MYINTFIGYVVRYGVMMYRYCTYVLFLLLNNVYAYSRTFLQHYNGMCLFKEMYDNNCNGATVLITLICLVAMPLECMVIVLISNLILSACELLYLCIQVCC